MYRKNKIGFRIRDKQAAGVLDNKSGWERRTILAFSGRFETAKRWYQLGGDLPNYALVISSPNAGGTIQIPVSVDRYISIRMAAPTVTGLMWLLTYAGAQRQNDLPSVGRLHPDPLVQAGDHFLEVRALKDVLTKNF